MSDYSKCKSYGEYVIAEVEKEPEGMIVRPDNVEQKVKWAKVLSVGSKVEGLNPGDRITWKDSAIFNKNNQIVNMVSGVYLDKPARIASVHKDIIVAVDPCTPQNS